MKLKGPLTSFLKIFQLYLMVFLSRWSWLDLVCLSPDVILIILFHILFLKGASACFHQRAPQSSDWTFTGLASAFGLFLLLLFSSWLHIDLLLHLLAHLSPSLLRLLLLSLSSRLWDLRFFIPVVHSDINKLKKTVEQSTLLPAIKSNKILGAERIFILLKVCMKKAQAKSLIMTSAKQTRIYKTQTTFFNLISLPWGWRCEQTWRCWTDSALVVLVARQVLSPTPVVWTQICFLTFFCVFSVSVSHVLCHIHSLMKRRVYKCHQLKIKLWKVISINNIQQQHS